MQPRSGVCSPGAALSHAYLRNSKRRPARLHVHRYYSRLPPTRPTYSLGQNSLEVSGRVRRMDVGQVTFPNGDVIGSKKLQCGTSPPLHPSATHPHPPNHLVPRRLRRRQIPTSLDCRMFGIWGILYGGVIFGDNGGPEARVGVAGFLCLSFCNIVRVKS